MRIVKSAFCLALATLMLNGCVIGYRKYPRNQLNAPPPEKKYAKMYYTVDGTSLAGGYLALDETLRNDSPFREVEPRDKAPEKGLYVRAKIDLLSPSVAAAAFIYLSYATLTLLPGWSAQDGARIRFTVYRDGAIVKTYQYEVRRFGILWLPMLPLIWANLLTANERQTFTAIAKQFFVDADPVFQQNAS